MNDRESDGDRDYRFRASSCGLRHARWSLGEAATNVVRFAVRIRTPKPFFRSEIAPIVAGRNQDAIRERARFERGDARHEPEQVYREARAA